MDPLSFRRQNMRTDGDFFRWTAVLEAAVAASGYKAHVAASNLAKGNVVEGWGMAIGTHGASRAATVAHIQVDKSSGKITILHLIAGQDSGLAISPELIENQMSGNLMQGASKILHEELQFSKNRVTSRDWVSYPMLRFKEHPKVTTVVVVRNDQNPTGSGEPPQVPVGACCRERVLRRNRPAHLSGTVDAGPRPRRACRPRQGLLVHALPKLERIGPARARSAFCRRASRRVRHDEERLTLSTHREAAEADGAESSAFDLDALGWRDEDAEQLPAGTEPGRVVTVHRGELDVATAAGTVRARVPGASRTRGRTSRSATGSR